jgi:hypothetical protein
MRTTLGGQTGDLGEVRRMIVGLIRRQETSRCGDMRTTLGGQTGDLGEVRRMILGLIRRQEALRLWIRGRA